MARLLVLLFLIAVAYWLYREVVHARRQQASLKTPDSRRRSVPPPHQRVPDDAFDQRLEDLRAAVTRGDVTLDEASDSLVRFAGGGLTTDRARRLLDR